MLIDNAVPYLLWETYTLDVEGGKFKLSVGGLVIRLEHISYSVGDA